MGGILHSTVSLTSHLKYSIIKMSDKAATPKKKTAAKPKVPASHPPYLEMVCAAINEIAGPRGASRQAILKYVCEKYKVDPAKAAVHVRMCLRNSVEKGKLKTAREKGKGAGGFKVVKEEKPKKASKAGKSPAKKAPKPKAAP